MKAVFLGLVLCFSLTGINAHAQPSCLAGGQELGVNNQAVLGWKVSTHDQYHNRAHIQGILSQVYPDHSGHKHLQVRIGQGATDTVEVIYNQDFGAVSNPAVGSQVEACGDYITARDASGGYPPSPDGAIVHWVHQSPSPDRHDSGYLMINGQSFGSDSEVAGPKHGGYRPYQSGGDPQDD